MGSCLLWEVRLSSGLIQQRSQARQRRELSAAAIKRVYLLWNNISGPFEHLASAYHKCFTIKASINNSFLSANTSPAASMLRLTAKPITITRHHHIIPASADSLSPLLQWLWRFASGSTHSLGRDGRELYHVGMLEQINWRGNTGGLDLHYVIDRIPNVFPLQWGGSDPYHEAGKKAHETDWMLSERN